MYSFRNDYSEGAHPRILAAISAANLEQNSGYGTDPHSAAAAALVKKAIGREDVDVHMLVGGTQTNSAVITWVLRPHQAVIAACTGHINVHETGAVEASGHKVLAIPCEDGKVTPAMVLQALADNTSEHMVRPGMVYISNTTEIGTQYSKAELTALHEICAAKGLYLFLDGARLGSALTSPINDLTLTDLAELTDVFYIGGTKNGALFGECLVIVNPALKQDFRYIMKQRGALLAKGFLLGIQFEELFRDDLFFTLAAHANRMAALLREGIEQRGFSLAFHSMSNQLFLIVTKEQEAALAADFAFEPNGMADPEHPIIRLVTSWATTEAGVQEFLAALDRL